MGTVVDVVWLKILIRLMLGRIYLLCREFMVMSQAPTVPSQSNPMSQSYLLAESALQHCYLTYVDGDLTLDEYLVLKQAVWSVMFRSIE
jgi:hypothetical protein